MKISLGFVAAALVIVAGLATSGLASAGSWSGPTIFVDNYDYVTAYPVGASGNVAPIAITPDMIFPAGIARDRIGRIFITNPSTNTVAIYPPYATGNVPPLEIIGGSKTRLASPSGIALDGNGNIYVLNSATSAITIYPPVSLGPMGKTTLLNQAPSAVIAGPKTKLKQPVAIAMDGSRDIYVANQAGGPVVPGQRISQGMITVYSAGSSGNVAPSITIRGSATGLIDPVSIALDSNRNIYVSNSFTYVGHTLIDDPSIIVFQAGSQGDANPTAVIGGTNTGLGFPLRLALDAGGNIYSTGFTSKGIPTINVYPAASNGNVSPITTVSGADTGLTSVSAMTLDSDGNLYVLDGEKVNIYSSGSNGDAAPINTISSSFTGINSSEGIAVDSHGNIYLTNLPGGPDFQGGSLSIFAPGSYATTAPAAMIAGDNTGLNYPQKVALDARGNISVLNFDNSINVYPAGSTGNVTPSATINVGGNIVPAGIARGSGGELYVADQGLVQCNNNGRCHQSSLGAVDVYPANAKGNANPSTVIAGYATGIASPSAVAVGKHGSIFVANEGPQTCAWCGCFPTDNGSITVYAAGSAGNAKPFATIQGPHSGIDVPQAIAVDSGENLYVLNAGGGLEANVFCVVDEPFLSQATNPVLIWENPPKDGSSIHLAPGIFKIDQLGTSGPLRILVFKAGSNGDAPPSAVIRGPFTAFDGGAIAIGPSGP